MPKDTEDEASPDEGMMSLEDYERLHPESDVVEEVEEDPDELPRVTDERLAELKLQARRMIEERLKAKRKQRKLLRGGWS